MQKKLLKILHIAAERKPAFQLLKTNSYSKSKTQLMRVNDKS